MLQLTLADYEAVLKLDASNVKAKQAMERLNQGLNRSAETSVGPP